MQLIYCGIGSRQTPSDMLAIFTVLGKRMAERGHILRSGAADGADTAFEKGCDQVQGKKEIYLPWPGFNGRRNGSPNHFPYPTQAAQELASQFHPNWGACNNGARCLHARNSHQVFGWSMDQPSHLVICWTPDAKGNGGTGQAIRLARHFNIPVFDLADRSNFNALETFVEEQEEA